MAQSRGALRRMAIGAVRALGAMALLYALAMGPAALAQSAGGSGIASLLQKLSPTDVQQLFQQGQGSQPSVTVKPSVMPQGTTLTPGGVQQAVPKTPSQLEKIMSRRAGTDLTQFGYDQLVGGQPVQSVQIGAIQDSYILGTGDQLDISLRGQENAEYVVTVDRNGSVSIPKLAPMGAAGRSLGDFKRDVKAAIQRAYISTKAYITVQQIRQISVLVVGNVRNPGQQTLTGLSTILDALNLAGGITKAGSLRNIVIVRGSDAFRLDLYDFLTRHRATRDLTVAQGDRIIVPALGATVAVTGAVRQPGIYELPHGSQSITERGVINLAQGPQLPGVYREMILKIRRNGKEELVDASGRARAAVRNGEILFVQPAVNYSSGRVTLAGSVRVPGTYALDKTKTLHDLLPSTEVFAPTPYMLLGVIIRINPKTLQRTVVPFSPIRVIEGKENMNLISDDVVRILTIPQMRAIASWELPQSENNGDMAVNANPNIGTMSQSALATLMANPNCVSQALAQAAGGQAPSAAQTGAQSSTSSGSSSGSTATPAGGCPINTLAQTTAPASAGGTASPSETASNAATDNGTSSSAAEPAGLPGLGDLSAEDRAFFGQVLTDYRVTLSGAVRAPGAYLIAPGTSLAELLAAANGLTTDADTSSFEITSTEIDNRTGRSTTHRRTMTAPPSAYDTVALHLLDSVNFHHVFTDRQQGTVTVAGQVRYPGTYSLLRGEHLSEVLVRAGGLTNVAYPYGTVFLRQSLAQREKESHQKLAKELELQLVQEISSGASATSGNQAINTSAFTGIEGFINSVKTEPTIGRMTVIADPTILAANPQNDPMMQPGDTIFIPTRPSTVSVMGAVMAAGNYQFRPDATVEDYINQAGGYADGAEDDMTYIVYPDGSARRVDESWLHFTSAAIPPGSTVYVPRDLFPVNWQILTTTVATLFRELAVSAASIAVLSKNN